MVEIIPPSIECKIIEHKYSQYLNQLKTYQGYHDFIKVLSRRLQFYFYLPEYKILRQQDTSVKKVFVTGSGKCNVYSNLHYTKDTLIGIIDEGMVLGECQFIFNTSSYVTIEAKQHISMAAIDNEDLNDILLKHESIKMRIQKSLLSNPFDLNRDYAVKIMRQSSDYLSSQSDETLRRLYYLSDERFYEYGDMLFNIGDAGKSAFIIIYGAVEIGLSEGKNYMSMDFLSKGSAIGFNTILTGREWAYQAKVKSIRATIVKIDISTLEVEIKNSPLLEQKVNEYQNHLL